MYHSLVNEVVFAAMNEHQETIAEEFAKEAEALRQIDLPPELVSHAKRLLLDFCGSAIGGVSTDSFQMAARAFSDVPQGKFSVVQTGPKALPEYAALLNAIAGHSLETDDIQNRSSIHLGVVVMPAVLAACEMSPVSGSAALKAIVAGYEVSGRIGRAVNPKDQYAKGFHPTATCGPYGAAMGAAYVMGLSSEQITNAIALASVGSAGLTQFLHDGSLIKRLQPAWACHTGIVAAKMAAAGYTGPRTIFEGANGFLRAYSSQPDEPQARGAWVPCGRELMDTAIKPHATCRYNQSPVDGVLEIVCSQDLTPDQIISIEIGLLGVALPIVGEPLDFKRRPQSVVDAQFSVPFAAAVAAVRRRASVEEHALDVIRSQSILEMMDKVTVVHRTELDTVYPKQWPATVTITTKEGHKLESRVDYPRGDPMNPLNWEETVDKFKALTGSLESASQDQIVDIIDRFETIKDARELTHALRVRSEEEKRDA